MARSPFFEAVAGATASQDDALNAISAYAATDGR
jgi:hypothetical protein